MSDRFLFWAPTLIWATTWHAILYQLGEVSVLHSVALRFGLASLMLFAIARWRGEPVGFSAGLHGWLLLTGAVQYGLSYVATYQAEKTLASGLLAVLYSLMIFTNAIGGALFFGQAITRRFLLSGAVGVAGIVLIFWPDIAATRAGSGVLGAIGVGLLAVMLSSVGNVLTLRLRGRGAALVPLLAWSMGYGALALLVISYIAGVEFRLDLRVSYWLSLLYLSAFGSVTAFLLYFKLAHRQGPGRAALVGLIIPVMALLMSALFEGWRPTWVSGAGIVLSLMGLWGATRPALAPAPVA